MNEIWKCGELLRGQRFSLRMKGMVYCTCVGSAMLYGSETWCLRKSEKVILKTERVMARSMCGVKLVDRKNILSHLSVEVVECTPC